MAESILIVEDHDAIRDGLCEWLGLAFPQYQFVAVASGEDALVASQASQLVLILMDISLPGMCGIEVTRRIKAQGTGASIVMLSYHEEEVYRTAAADAGACAYVTKRQMQTELIPTMQAIMLEEDVTVLEVEASSD